MWETINCIPSLKEKKPVENEICTSFDFGKALEEVYPLLQIIFEKLPYEDLKTAAMINIWDKYSSDELGKRNKASWISFSRSDAQRLVLDKKPHPLDKSSNFKYDSTAFGLVFYNYHEIKLTTYVCIHDDPVRKLTFSEYLRTEIIPGDKDFWAFSCSQIYSPKLNKGCYTYFSSVLIPEIPDINVRKFIVSCDKADSIFKKRIPKDEYIRCVLLFTLSYPNLIIKKFTEELLKRENARAIAIGGGVIEHGIKPFQEDKKMNFFKSNTLFCIALTQENHKSAEFDAFSAVISEDVDFEEELHDFKSRIKLREQSFAFRICCAAKDGKDTETSVFNKVFPNTFVIGLDAGGEIGWDKLDSWEPEGESEAKKQKMRPNLCHQYTTIIVLLTWGKKL